MVTLVDKRDYQYQHGFSELHSEEMYDTAGREQKANKSLAVIDDFVGKAGLRRKDLYLLDIGCSTGYMTHVYGQYFGRATGIDIDAKAVGHARESFSNATISFEVRDSMNTGFADSSFDAVICTHVYEHVPDAERLVSEIHRVLKPGGFCYFAAGNRFTFMEPHYRLPLLSVIPKFLADYYIRWVGKADFYYEKHRSLWGLKHLVRKFELHDYTLEVIRDPVKYHATEMLRPGSLKQKVALAILRTMYWVCPTYIWVLVKRAEFEAADHDEKT